MSSPRLRGDVVISTQCTCRRSQVGCLRLEDTCLSPRTMFLPWRRVYVVRGLTPKGSVVIARRFCRPHGVFDWSGLSAVAPGTKAGFVCRAPKISRCPYSSGPGCVHSSFAFAPIDIRLARPVRLMSIAADEGICRPHDPVSKSLSSSSRRPPEVPRSGSPIAFAPPSRPYLQTMLSLLNPPG